MRSPTTSARDDAAPMPVEILVQDADGVGIPQTIAVQPSLLSVQTAGVAVLRNSAISS